MSEKKQSLREQALAHATACTVAKATALKCGVSPQEILREAYVMLAFLEGKDNVIRQVYPGILSDEGA